MFVNNKITTILVRILSTELEEMVQREDPTSSPMKFHGQLKWTRLLVLGTFVSFRLTER
jgi:hypothetical protein